MTFSKFQQTMSDGCQHSGLRCDAILLCNAYPDLGRASGEEKLPHGNSRKLINACRIAIRMQLSGAGKCSRSLEMRGKLVEKQLRFSFAHTSWPEPTINRRRARKSNSGENYYLISFTSNPRKYSNSSRDRYTSWNLFLLTVSGNLPTSCDEWTN